MDKQINISVSGFYSTGSSAVVDLLSEFDGVSVALDRRPDGTLYDYEHAFFNSYGGVIHLSEILLNLNTRVTTPKAINAFVECYRTLYENDFARMGSYKVLIGKPFWDMVDDFLKDIKADPRYNKKSFSHYVAVKFSIVILMKQLVKKMIYKTRIVRPGRKVVFDGKPGYLAFPTKEEVAYAVQKFCNRYFDLCNKDGLRFNVYNMLLSPCHIPFSEIYFPDLKQIYVTRDPREVFFNNKYKIKENFLPYEVEDFANMWKEMLRIPPHNNKNVLIVSFNDLVYKYEETLKTIMDFVGLEEAAHIRKKVNFNPERSIKNTQNFTISPEIFKESEELKALLPDLCYDYPYVIKTSLKEMFTGSDRKK